MSKCIEHGGVEELRSVLKQHFDKVTAREEKRKDVLSAVV